jgi:2,5-furandicarboxylate decarboxylase 1
MSLRGFLNLMERKDEILHVKERLSTRFELSHLIRSCDDEGPTLSFDKVMHHRTKVIANICGTRRRINMALNVNQKDFCHKILQSWRSPKKPEVVSGGKVKECLER